MLTLRLSRVGTTKKPTYRLIVSEKGRDPWGTYLELLGTYNPRATEKKPLFNAERIKYWISKGAQASATVHNLLINEKIIEGKKVKAAQKSRGPKTEEKPA